MITDEQVCQAFHDYNTTFQSLFPHQLLQKRTGTSVEECFDAIESARDKDLIEYGVSLRTSWLTEKGKDLLK